jgi:hypothetical protein
MTTELLDELQALPDAGTPGEADTTLCGYLAIKESQRRLIPKLVKHAPALLSAARENLRLREALEDAVSGLQYIRLTHGELSGVGFDRVFRKYDSALGKEAP